jgi:hypothetical protein
MMQDRWRYLLRYLRPDRPPPLAEMDRLYVHPPRSSASEIVRKFEADPTGMQKFLLVGARGGGKSTELREVARRLGDKAVIASIDLDASGVTATTVSAFDLLYLSGLALLRLVPENDQDDLYKELTRAYGGKDSASLGKNVRDALSGLVSFADAAGKTAALLDLGVGVPLFSAGLGAINAGVRLLSRDRIIAETSPEGRGLQHVCHTIVKAARMAHQGRPLCVLIDGLEKINGEANERFQQVFCYTRLLVDAEWTAAIAAPPSTLTETNSAVNLGYVTLPVWGFAPEDASVLQELLRRRFQAAGLDPDTLVDPSSLARLVEQSGGLPRHAILMLQQTVESALHAGAERIDPEDIEDGIRRVAEELGLGLTEEDLQILARVHRRNQLPGNERAARLFADGRILARAPAPGRRLTQFFVHPVLEPEIIYEHEHEHGYGHAHTDDRS